MSQHCKAASFEIYETKGKWSPGDKDYERVLVPDRVLINGEEFWTSADDPITVTAGPPDKGLTLVNLTLIASRVVIEQEGRA